MVRTYYHATNLKGAFQIICDGVVKPSADRYVYCCTDPVSACKFEVIRGETNIFVIEFELEEEDVQESFDHSFEFFQCRAYRYEGEILLGKNPKIQNFQISGRMPLRTLQGKNKKY